MFRSSDQGLIPVNFTNAISVEIQWQIPTNVKDFKIIESEGKIVTSLPREIIEKLKMSWKEICTHSQFALKSIANWTRRVNPMTRCHVQKLYIKSNMARRDSRLESVINGTQVSPFLTGSSRRGWVLVMVREAPIWRFHYVHDEDN